jgi:hypothetical protein
MTYWLAAGMLGSIICPCATAATVVVGQHVLLPNTANQTISIWVSGGEQIAGEDFYAQIGDGGSFLGGSNAKPAFTSVNVIANTIFSASNNGAFGDPNGVPAGSNAAHPLIWVDGTTTGSGTVSAAGLLATLTLDTTGLASGTFPLLLTGVASSLGPFNTTLVGANAVPIPLSVTNGLLIVAVPTAGDYNRNGVVDAADYTVWRDSFGQTGMNLWADGNGDTHVDSTDFGIWKQDFGQTLGGGANAITVPEPRTGLLLVLVVLTEVAQFRCPIKPVKHRGIARRG